MIPLSQDLTLLDLFRIEVQNQCAVLNEGLLALERGRPDTTTFDSLMRSAHSLKGAARIVRREAAVHAAHAIEDYFVAVKGGGGTPVPHHIDALLAGVDLIAEIAGLDDAEAVARTAQHEASLQRILVQLKAALPASGAPDAAAGLRVQAGDAPQTSSLERSPADSSVAGLDAPGGAAAAERLPIAPSPRPAEQGLRIKAVHLDRLLGIAGETLIARRWVSGFSSDLLRLKRLHAAAVTQLDAVRAAIPDGDERAQREVAAMRERLAAWEQAGTTALAGFDDFDRRFRAVSERLQHEVLDCRMRPFGEGLQGFPRMVRDLARALGKSVRLDIQGETTPVDRMLLEQLDAPLGHLVRNAVDHGIELAAERLAAGKPEAGTVLIEARCTGGKLLVTVADDGRGIDVDALRAVAASRNVATPEVASTLSEAELMEFLFLPGFTMKPTVTDISGRGVGLDVVQTTVRQVGGNVRVVSRPTGGLEFQLQLPLTLSVVRAIIAEIAGEAYAVPLSRVDGVLHLPMDAIDSVHGRQHASFRGERFGIVDGRQVLGFERPGVSSQVLAVIVLGERAGRVGLVVDRLVGEGELVIRHLDPRLGKVKNVSAAALMPDGSPVLVIDVDDLMRSIDRLISGPELARCSATADVAAREERKRVLVVDDSITVRELERKLLAAAGYDVTVAVDGMDGWNAVREGRFDLVVTDIDMPRLDGIELVALIRKDARLRSLPVMIVSYKDRAEDRRRGLDAGADYYLPKASFQDDALIGAVRDLIGGGQ